MPELPINSSAPSPALVSAATLGSSARGSRAGSAAPSLPTDLGTRLRQGFAWNLVASACTQGGAFAGNVIVARLLGTHDFGLFAMVQATLAPLAMVVYWAACTTVAKYVAEYRTWDRERAGRILALCGAACLAAATSAGVLLAALAVPLAAHVLEAPQLDLCLMVGAVYVMGTSFAGYQAGILSGLVRASQVYCRAAMLHQLEQATQTCLMGRAADWAALADHGPPNRYSSPGSRPRPRLGL